MHSDMSVVMLGQKRVPSLNGGIERVLTELVKQGVAVTCLNRAGEPIVDGDYPKTKGPFKGVKLRSVWTIRGKGLSAVSASVSGAVRALFGGFDVVHFHAEGPSAMIWLPKLFKKRCVVTVHGLDWKRDKWRGGFGARYIKFGERMIAKYADAIIVLNVDTRRYFEQTYHRESYYIPNGVSPVTAQGAALIGERYGLAPRDYVLSVSRLTPEKGLHDLIAAFRQLDTTKRLVIAGGDSDTAAYQAELKKAAAGDPRILFTGFVAGQTLAELYANAATFVLPSRIEGMPLALLEALAYDNRVVASAIPEIQEVAKDRATYFAPGDVAGLAEALRHSLAQPAPAGANAAFVHEHFDWAHTAAATKAVYQQVLASGRRG